MGNTLVAIGGDPTYSHELGASSEVYLLDTSTWPLALGNVRPTICLNREELAEPAFSLPAALVEKSGAPVALVL